MPFNIVEIKQSKAIKCTEGEAVSNQLLFKDGNGILIARLKPAISVHVDEYIQEANIILIFV